MAMQAVRSGLIGDETPQARAKSAYLDCLALVERLHRRLLDVLKEHLERSGWSDVNAVQALLVYNIGEHEMTAGELKSRGYYQGSNVSYNLKKLVEMGYIHHAPAQHDRRAVRISLTDRGRELRDVIDAMYDQHLEAMAAHGGMSEEDITALRRALRGLERFWGDQLHFSV